MIELQTPFHFFINSNIRIHLKYYIYVFKKASFRVSCLVYFFQLVLEINIFFFSHLIHVLYLIYLKAVFIHVSQFAMLSKIGGATVWKKRCVERCPLIGLLMLSSPAWLQDSVPSCSLVLLYQVTNPFLENSAQYLYLV